MINRRHMLKLVSLAALLPVKLNAEPKQGFGPLRRDPARIIDLPADFTYQVISRAGEEMSDGFLTPAMADGMAAFDGGNGLVNLVCNHENYPTRPERGPFGNRLQRLDRIGGDLLYDGGSGTHPGQGGTSTIVYDPASGQSQKQFMSLLGTELNCAGGATPWGSWLSCEEAFSGPPVAGSSEQDIAREQRHGYVFEVPAVANTAVDPVPLRAMGRFEHEAAAVNPASGVVYLSEDRHRSLFYRFLPAVPAKLSTGGQLQALSIQNRPRYDTRNWGKAADMPANKWMQTQWIDLKDVDSDENNLRLRGYSEGAAIFARGEGLCHASGSIFLTCTIGGPDRLGQIFEYRVSPAEGSNDEISSPGAIRLVAESRPQSILHHADNINVSPWGDLLVCEDTSGHCQLIGIQPDGLQYPLLANTHSPSELAGICFSPDGSTMFVNVQKRGLTLAIRGPW